MIDNSGEYVAKPIGAPHGAHETVRLHESVSHDATYSGQSWSNPSECDKMSRIGQVIPR